MAIDLLLRYLSKIKKVSQEQSKQKWFELEKMFQSAFINFLCDDQAFDQYNLSLFFQALFAVRYIDVEVMLLICCVKSLISPGREVKMRLFFFAASQVFHTIWPNPDEKQKESLQSLFLKLNVQLERECPSVYSCSEAQQALFMDQFTSQDCALKLAQEGCFHALTGLLTCRKMLPRQEWESQSILNAPIWQQVDRYLKSPVELPITLYAALGCADTATRLVHTNYGYNMCLFLMVRLWDERDAGEAAALDQYRTGGVKLYLDFLERHQLYQCETNAVLDFMANFPYALAYGCSLSTELSALRELDASKLFLHPAREALSAEKLGDLIKYRSQIDLEITQGRSDRRLDDYAKDDAPIPLSTSFASASLEPFNLFEITPFVNKIAAIDFLMQQKPGDGDTAVLVDDRAAEFKWTCLDREGYTVKDQKEKDYFEVILLSALTVQVWLPAQFQQAGVDYVKENFSSDRLWGVFFDVDDTVTIPGVSAGPVEQDTIVAVGALGQRVSLITNSICSRRKKFHSFLAQCDRLVCNLPADLIEQETARPSASPGLVASPLEFTASHSSSKKGSGGQGSVPLKLFTRGGSKGQPGLAESAQDADEIDPVERGVRPWCCLPSCCRPKI